MSQVAATFTKGEWIRHRVTEGAKGPREYEFTRIRVIEKRHRAPGPWSWMMVRRPVGCWDPKEFKYYLSNAPETVALAEMAWVGCLRWTIEEDFELSKGPALWSGDRAAPSVGVLDVPRCASVYSPDAIRVHVMTRHVAALAGIRDPVVIPGPSQLWRFPTRPGL